MIELELITFRPEQFQTIFFPYSRNQLENLPNYLSVRSVDFMKMEFSLQLLTL